MLLFVALLLLSACKEDESVPTQAQAQEAPLPVVSNAPAVATASTAPQGLVNGPDDPSGGQPQPRLQTRQLWVGTNEITAEIAANGRQIAIGMMRRTNMAEMEGMLFVMPGRPQQIAFYMRNTLLPLSCAYIDADGTIVEIYDMKPLDETPLPSKSDQIQYVLEMKQGWFDRHGVRPGVAIATDRGSLAQTFRRR